MRNSGQSSKPFVPRIFVLYIFAGSSRHADIRDRLSFRQTSDNFDLHILEYDLLRSTENDVTAPFTWKEICTHIQSGAVDVLIITPPCNTFSRARHTYRSSPGPKPLRNLHWPLGFPWLQGQDKESCDVANQIIKQTVEACNMAFDNDVMSY